MAPDEPRGARPAGPVVLRIKLRYDDVEAMIARFAVNVGKTGLFLPTKSIQPTGTEIKFELRLSTDRPVLVGVGRVKAARVPDPEDPGAAYGMAVELMRVTRESRELILKMLERRRQLGLPEQGLPMPADVDAARRAEVMESGVRDATSGALPQLTTPVLESAPVLTAPRRNTGPLAIAKATAIQPLAPEPPRRRRVPVGEVIASASGPIAAPAPSEGLDESVDVAAALARARMLASGSDLDGELEALRDAAAVPIEIGIEAASAELARQLGGSAVSKSARWAPPPPTQIAEPVPLASAPPLADAPVGDANAPLAPAASAEPELAGEEPVAETAVGAAPEAPDPEPPAIADAATPVGVQPAIAAEEAEPALFADRQPAFAHDAAADAPMIYDGADPADFEDAQEVEPDQIHDEIHRLSDHDIEELEHTQIGEMPVDENAFAQHAYATIPSDTAAIAHSLDQQLAEAEREDMGFATMQPYTDESSPFDPSLEAALVAAASAEAVDGDPIEEIQDFEILAEADAEDADLLAVAAEQELTMPRPATPSPEDPLSEDPLSEDPLPEDPLPEDPPSRPSFLNRLSFDEESGHHVPAPSHFADEFAHDPGPVDPRILSAGYALSAFEGDASAQDQEHDFNAPGTYTPIPEAPPEPGFDDFDAPHGNYSSGVAQYVPQDAFDQSDVIAVPPAVRTSAQRRADDEDFPDLESALEALDVDLDDLSDPSKVMPRNIARTDRPQRSRPPLAQDARIGKRAGGRVHKRATTEDGIVIDFDDED